jgi:PAS domain S-box-containing protein
MVDVTSGHPYPAEDKLRLIETLLSVGTWSWDRQNGDVAWSPGLFRLVGLESGKIVPSLSLYESLAHPEDRLPLTDPEALATDGRQRDRRARVIRPDGELRWVRSFSKTLFDRMGKVRGVIAVATDVTENEELRRGLQSAHAFDAVVGRLINVDLWKADEAGNLLRSSAFDGPNARQIPDNLRVEGWRAVVPAEERPAVEGAWRNAVASGTEYSITHHIELDGHRHMMHVRGVPFDDPATSERRWVGVATPRTGILEPDADEPIDPEGLRASLIRAARAYMDWSLEDLAKHAGLSLSTIRRVEASDDPRSRARSTRAVRAAFEKVGLSFRRDKWGRPHFVDTRPV